MICWAGCAGAVLGVPVPCWVCRRWAGCVLSPRGAGMAAVASFGCSDRARVVAGSGPGGCVELGGVSGSLWHWRVPGSWRSRQHWHSVGARGALWAPAGAVVPLGRTLWAVSHRDGCAFSDAARCRGCARRGQTEPCVLWRDVLVLEPLRPARTPHTVARSHGHCSGSFGAAGASSCPRLVLPAPRGARHSVDLPGATGGHAAQALPSPLLFALPGPRFCQPSTYQQEVKRLPESEVRTGGQWAAGPPSALFSSIFK